MYSPLRGRGLRASRVPARTMFVLRRFLKNVRNNSPWGLVQTALTAIDDLAFDWRYGLDTSGITPLKDLAIDSRHVAHGVHYAPTRVRYFQAVLRALPIPRNSVFVDLGAGKGRMLLLAAQSGRFRKVVGVEFSAELCRTAEQNIRRFQRHCGGSVRFEVVHADAADYEVQPDQNVFFMFNPFGPVVMEQVVRRIGRSLEEMPRRTWVICLGLREGCPAILAENGYQETGLVTYGSAKVSILVNDASQIKSRSYSQAREGLAVS